MDVPKAVLQGPQASILSYFWKSMPAETCAALKSLLAACGVLDASSLSGCVAFQSEVPI